MLRRLRDSGLGIIYISHFLEEVREIADRFTALRDGRIEGTPNDTTILPGTTRFQFKSPPP